MSTAFWFSFGAILVGSLVFLVCFDIYDERRHRRRIIEQGRRRP